MKKERFTQVITGNNKVTRKGDGKCNKQYLLKYVWSRKQYCDSLWKLSKAGR